VFKWAISGQSAVSPILVHDMRKRGKEILKLTYRQKKSILTSTFGNDVPLTSVYCFGHNGMCYLTSFSRPRGKKSPQKSFSRGDMLRTRTANVDNEDNPNEQRQDNSNQLIENPRKRQRQFSWQRHRKRRQFDIQETHSLIQFKRNVSDREGSYASLQSGFNSSASLSLEKVFFFEESVKQHGYVPLKL
ncbi:hypothetical protein U1Q18_023314, partial [Sarracenia purpurea var. burkii]